MEIIKDQTGNSKIAYVVPVMNAEKYRKSDDYNFIRANNLGDLYIVEDSSPDFCFSKSMNEGIREALKDKEYEFVILSTDNIQMTYKDKMKLVDYVRGSHYGIDYAIPKKVNDHLNAFILTDSVAVYLFTSALEKLPFYAIRKYIGYRKAGLPNMYSVYHSKGMPNIMPWVMFSRDIMERYKFDENIRNCFEDNDFSARLHIDHKRYEYIDINVIHRHNVSFSKINTKNKLSGFYNVEDFKKNVIYMHKKFFEGKHERNKKRNEEDKKDSQKAIDIKGPGAVCPQVKGEAGPDTMDSEKGDIRSE